VVFWWFWAPKWDSPWKIVNNHLRSQASCAFAITHQGQCPHQVSLNLANPHFQGLTRFLSQGLLSYLLQVPVRMVESRMKTKGNGTRKRNVKRSLPSSFCFQSFPLPQTVFSYGTLQCLLYKIRQSKAVKCPKSSVQSYLRLLWFALLHFQYALQLAKNALVFRGWHQLYEFASACFSDWLTVTAFFQTHSQRKAI